MILELVIRFIVGGLVVCAFSVIGDALKPKSFAGIFGAAPSVALATLGLTIMKHGGQYASVEGRSMIAGAIGLILYSLLTGRLLLGREGRTLPLTAAAIAAWFIAAFGIWAVVLR